MTTNGKRKESWIKIKREDLNALGQCGCPTRIYNKSKHGTTRLRRVRVRVNEHLRSFKEGTETPTALHCKTRLVAPFYGGYIYFSSFLVLGTVAQ